MADILNFLENKKKRNEETGDYRDRLRRHRLTRVYRVVLVVLAAVAVIALLVVSYKNRTFSSYSITNTAARDAVSDAIDLRLGRNVLTYSKDGAHVTDAKGNVLWNRTYEIQDAIVAVCGDVSAIGNYNGRDIYVQSSEEELGSITTTMPIRAITVSGTGRVTAALADTDVTWINTYEANGESIYTGQAHMDEGGYPVSLSLSPNGELLAISYLYVDAGVIKTNLVFYNFGPVGENQSDYLVSAYTYTDIVFPKVQFMNNQTAFAVGDSRLVLFTGDQKPQNAGEYLFDEEVQSVYYNDSYVGLVFLAESEEGRYRMDVYNTQAVKVGSYFFDVEYTDVFFTEDAFVVYNETECAIYTLEGALRYSGAFTKSVRLMAPTGSQTKYLLVGESSIDTIQLR